MHGGFQMLNDPVDTNELSNRLYKTSTDPYTLGESERNIGTEIPNLKPSLTGALLRTENLVGSLYKYMQTNAVIDSLPALEGYNWRDGVPLDQQHNSFQYVGADSPDKALEITYGIRQREADRAKIAENAVQSFLTGIPLAALDITNFIPGISVVRNLTRAKNTLYSAAAVAASNVASNLALEAVLMPTQVDREFKEVVASTVGAAVAGGVIGGGIGYFFGKTLKNAKYDIADAAIDGLGPPKERPINDFSTKEEVVSSMQSENKKLAERNSFDESLTSLKESSVLIDGTTGKVIYEDMSIPDLIHSIKTSDLAIDAYNMVNSFLNKVPLTKSVIKRSYLYAKLSKNELIKLVKESDAALAALRKNDDVLFSKINQDQASMIANANDNASYARMTKDQAVAHAMNYSELSKYAAVEKRSPAIETTKTEVTAGAKIEDGSAVDTKSTGGAESSFMEKSGSLEDLLKMEELAGPAGKVMKLLSFISPRNSMMNSPNPFIRELADMFFESNWVKNKFNPEGANVSRVTSAETSMKIKFGAITKVIKEYMDIFYKQAGVEGKFGLFRPERAMASSEGLSIQEFGYQVANALRNGDLSENPAVQQAAQLLRNKGFEPLKELAIKQGRLPENVSVETADSYLTRMFNNQMIKENQNRFYSAIQPWFKQKNDELIAMQPMIRGMQDQIDSAKKELKTALTPAGQKVVQQRITELESSLKMIEDIESKITAAQAELKTALKDENRKAIQLRISELKKASKKANDESLKIDLADLKDKELFIKKLEDDLAAERLKLKSEPDINIRRTIREGIKDLKEQLKSQDKQGVKAQIKKLKSFEPAVLDIKNQIASAEAELKKASSGEDKQLIRSKIEELKTSLRSANKNKVTSKIDELKKKLERPDRESVKNRIDELETKLNESVPNDLKDSDGNIRKVIESDEQMSDIIHQTIDNVLGRGAEKLANPMAGRLSGKGKAKPLHSRAWLIPDELIQDFLVNDPLEILENYAKNMIPELELGNLAKKIFDPIRINARLKELTKKLEVAKTQKHNTFQVGQLMDAIDVETKKIAEINSRLAENPENPTIEMAVSQMMREASDFRDSQLINASPSEAAAIEKAFDVAEKNILDSIEILMGVYKNGSNTIDGTAGTVLRNIKKWNYLRYMGYMTISSLPDIAMHVLRHGPVAFVREGLLPAFKQINALGKLEHNKNMLQDMGRCLEVAMGQRLKAFVDGEAIVVQPGKITKAFDYMSNRYGNATIFNQWQDLMQFIAGNMSMSRTFRDIDGLVKTGKMSKESRLRLNTLGLGESHWNNIHSEWKRTGGIQDGSYWSDYGSWNLEHPGIADSYHSFQASIIAEIDSTNIRTGMGDKPRIAYDNTLSMILQFRGFMLAATNNIALSGLSRNDQNFYMGLTSLIAMGGLSYVISSKLKHPEKEVDLSPGVFLLNAVDRCGAAGVFMEGFNVGTKLAGFDGHVSRYQQRSKLGNLLGPTAQAVDDINYVINAIHNSVSEDGETLNTKDIQKIDTLRPAQNIWWAEYPVKQLINKVAIGLGAEEA